MYGSIAVITLIVIVGTTCGLAPAISASAFDLWPDGGLLGHGPITRLTRRDLGSRTTTLLSGDTK
jgi:hypothetical protein